MEGPVSGMIETLESGIGADKTHHVEMKRNLHSAFAMHSSIHLADQRGGFDERCRDPGLLDKIMTPPPMGAGDLFPGCHVSKYSYEEWDVDVKDTITMHLCFEQPNHLGLPPEAIAANLAVELSPPAPPNREGAKWERHRYGQVWFRFSLNMETGIFNMVTKSLDLPGELRAIRKLLATADLLFQPVVAPSGASSNAPDTSGSRADVVSADTAAATTALVNLQGAGDQEVAKLTAERDNAETAEKGLEKVVEERDRLTSNSERQAKQITALNYAQVKLRNENAKLKEERTEAQNTKKKLEREAKDLRGKNAVLEGDRKAEKDRQQKAREEEDMRQKMLDAREQSFCEWERLLEQRERSLAERNTMNPGSHTQMSSEHIQQQPQLYPVGPNSRQFYAALETLRYCFHQNLNAVSWQEQQLRQSHQELEQRTQEMQRTWGAQLKDRTALEVELEKREKGLQKKELDLEKAAWDLAAKAKGAPQPQQEALQNGTSQADNNTIQEKPFRPIPASDNAASERRQSI
ncbi:hypothetical protein QC763_606930 [Podospora pseudopauciseta]|uniref:Uncharacterized protein n=1 Tax=Podospora pseudopauciseta TaxID=2093780 RepID=A0ABR0H5W6_9PEZI|nr:hypothetical protein QC763_606930 [Podospora pseudopauciseta]